MLRTLEKLFSEKNSQECYDLFHHKKDGPVATNKERAMA